jgi:hypothetical protein
MSLLDASGNKISGVGAPRVEDYKWVPKDMVIMISSRDVVVLMGQKKWSMTHEKYEKFKRDLQGKWDAEAKGSGSKTTEPKAEEGIKAQA